MDFPANGIEKPGYDLDFSDEFDAGSLDTTKWFPHMLPHWGGSMASRARYSMDNSSLKLLIERSQTPWIPGRDGGDRASNLQTGHFSGPIGSGVGQFKFDPALVVMEDIAPFRSYTPTYGYFEIRLRAVSAVGYHTALWMIGWDGNQAGEIRCFEIHGANIGAHVSRIDYGVLAWDDPTLTDECYEDTFPIDASGFHIYGVDWKPDEIDFFLDNERIRSVRQSPTYPMQFMLGIYERPRERTIDDDVDLWPKVCEVDYFRGYRAMPAFR
jgi:hypothetical protein